MKTETIKVTLWYREETNDAIKYVRAFADGSAMHGEKVWIPKSLIEHRTKEPNGRHVVTLPLWFVEKEGL